MKLAEIRNPRWANGGAAILVEVRTEGGDEFAPFVAAPDDVTEHGRQLFELAKAGEFGKVKK